jgi:hypothetical protein
MSFMDGETDKVNIYKVLGELEQLQQRFNERDVDWVVDLVLKDILDNDLSEMKRPPNGSQITNLRWFVLTLVGGPSKNLMESDSLSLTNFSTHDYMLF